MPCIEFFRGKKGIIYNNQWQELTIWIPTLRAWEPGEKQHTCLLPAALLNHLIFNGLNFWQLLKKSGQRWGNTP